MDKSKIIVVNLFGPCFHSVGQTGYYEMKISGGVKHMSMIMRPSDYSVVRNARLGNVHKSTSVNVPFPLPIQNEEDKKIDSHPSVTATGRNAIDSLAPNAPDSVRDAWNKAEKETGVNGYGKGADGKLTHISAMLTLQLEQRFTKGHSDLLGDTKQSAIEATQRALDRMGSSLWVSATPNSSELHKKERNFYEAFLKNLDAIK